jgi:hypothetical protein
MDNWLLTEVMAEQRRAAAERIDGRRGFELASSRGGLRGVLARTLVRFGLCLDRRAAETLLTPRQHPRREVTS